MMSGQAEQWSWTDFLFVYQPSRKLNWLCWVAVGCLFLGGLVLWAKFMNWGRGPYNFHDWTDITVPRLLYIQDALENGVLPLHVANTIPLHSVTDQFMAIHDVILSPQVFLLAFLSIDEFILWNTLLLYTVGFGGLLWLRSRFRLSVTAFGLYFLFLNFNGHILAHIGIGHLSFASYFLYPWFIGLIFELLDGRGNWQWTLKTSLWMLMLFLNGGYHQFIWALFFMGFVILTRWRAAWVIIRTAVASVLLCAVRILPLFLPLDKLDDRYVAGYPHLGSIWASLVEFQIPNDITLNQGMTPRPIGLWEFTLYIGMLGAVFILLFGIYRVITRPSQDFHYPEIILPSLGLLVLSLSKVYEILRSILPLPLITGERVASRIFVLGFLFILTLATIEFQRSLEKSGTPIAIKFLAPVLAIAAANDLWQNFNLWQVKSAAKFYEADVIDAGSFILANHPDSRYVAFLIIGLVISLLTLGILVYLGWNKAKHPASL